MNHEHYQQLVSEFIDREIRAADEEELFAHLNSCGECREFLKAACRMQADMAATKPQSHGRASYAVDRHPVRHQFRQSKRRSSISTVVLLVMVTLIVGMLFSANVTVQRSPETSTEEVAQPKY
jgi:predicted anti-sigma-YlaC factor YlaD